MVKLGLSCQSVLTFKNCFTGVLLGGFISDRFVVRSGPHGRIFVLIASQILAAPFAAGALLFSPPMAYISLLPTYIIGMQTFGFIAFIQI